jgi:hypothetical protein
VSRLDPVRERQDFLDAIEAQRERQTDDSGTPPEREVSGAGLNRPSGGPGHAPEVTSQEVRFERSRGLFYDRDHGYRLRESEVRALVDLGKFRIVAVDDLATHAYSGHCGELRDDLRNLLRQGLVRKGVFEGPEHNPRQLLTLTKQGARLLRRHQLVPTDQALYRGFVRPREANHDADLYPLYQKAIVGIGKEGIRNPRVILDFELKRKINRDIARLGRAARSEIARSHGLRVVREKIPVPDLRIEYEKPGGETGRVDLELATEHYRGRSLADKVHAGFTLYTPRGEADRLRRLLDQRELTAEILCL